jgi:hypothetical protein
VLLAAVRPRDMRRTCSDAHNCRCNTRLVDKGYGYTVVPNVDAFGCTLATAAAGHELLIAAMNLAAWL